MAGKLEGYRFENVNHFEADDRGRITLGSEFGDEQVFVAWSVVDIDEPDVITPSKEERGKLTELWKWARDNGHKMIDSDPFSGKILNGDAEWIDTDVEGLNE